jgi:hypothetical protein
VCLESGWKIIRRVDGSEVEAVLGMSILAMALLGGWVLAGSDRPDTLLYGRYLDPWAVPLALVGLQKLVVKGPISNRWLLIGISINVLSVALLLHASAGVSGPGRRIMGLSLGFLWWLCSGNLVPVVCIAATVVVCGLLAANSRTCLRFIVPVLMFCGLSIASTYMNHFHLDNVGEIAAAQVSLAQNVPAGEMCLSYDLATTKPYLPWLFRLELPNINHRPVDTRAGRSPCGKHIIAGDSFLNVCSETTKIATDERFGWSLWSYPAGGCG